MSLPPLKKWTPQECCLPGNVDFSFLDALPKAALQIAWQWEIQRELLSENGPLQANFERFFEKFGEEEKRPGVKLIPISERSELFRTVANELEHNPEIAASSMAAGATSHNGYGYVECIEIDWARSIEDLVADFKSEIEKRHLRIRPIKRGNRNDFFAWFNDLRLYRFKDAGLQKPDKQLSYPNWNHACDRTRKRIAKHFEHLSWRATQGPEAGNYPNWQSFFHSLL